MWPEIHPLTPTAQTCPCLIFMATALSVTLELFPIIVDSWVAAAAATTLLNIKRGVWRWLLLQNRKIPTGGDKRSHVYRLTASVSEQTSRAESQPQHGPVKARSSPCSRRCILAAGEDAAGRGRAGWSPAGGWKKQAGLLLRITNISTNAKQDSAPTRSYLLRARDKNLLTYTFSAPPRLFFFNTENASGSPAGSTGVTSSMLTSVNL